MGSVDRCQEDLLALDSFQFLLCFVQLLPKGLKVILRFSDDQQLLFDTLFEFFSFGLELSLSVELVLELVCWAAKFTEFFLRFLNLSPGPLDDAEVAG